MAAFNWIDFIANCPACQKRTTIRSQAHVAASFDGDETGRFCQRVYTLGEKLPWFPRGHRKYNTWHHRGDTWKEDDAREACYSTCQSCNAKLYAVIKFVNFTPVKVLDIGLESNWPEGYQQ